MTFNVPARRDPGYYQTLGVSFAASEDEIAAAYRALIRRHHPDAARGDQGAAEEISKRLNEAFSVLGDPDRRRAYDEEFGYSRRLGFDEGRWNTAPVVEEPVVTEPYAAAGPAARPAHELDHEEDEGGPSWPPQQIEHGAGGMLIWAVVIAIAAVLLIGVLIALSGEQRGPLAGG
jgi:curved DNA-binding protein CbpA